MKRCVCANFSCDAKATSTTEKRPSPSLCGRAAGLSTHTISGRVMRPSALLHVFHHDGGANPTANKPLRLHLQPPWIHRLDDVGSHLVGDRFMERAGVAEAPQVQLEALELHAGF